MKKRLDVAERPWRSSFILWGCLWCPMLCFFLGGLEKAMKKTAKELDGILGEWLEEHKRKRASSEKKGEEDFMDIMLSILDGAELEGYDADTINKATCLVRFLFTSSRSFAAFAQGALLEHVPSKAALKCRAYQK